MGLVFREYLENSFEEHFSGKIGAPLNQFLNNALLAIVSFQVQSRMKYGLLCFERKMLYDNYQTCN